ncbi:hypothetical protein FRC15_008509 [Serendipita sp. 397]|nr:hypothetical protein FRC15_008509 [Serendipita sp. 397]KAG8765170.1 hypothetical protein FRC16_008146 [Serendipita sp. 398]
MFKNVLFVLSALLIIVTVPATAQCTNNACEVANAIYKECKITSTSLADFKKCLCTKKFLVNYERCLNGTICSWDGTPDTLIAPCVKIYCPGTFVGGFDAKAFCAGSPITTTTTSIKPTKSIIKTLTPIYTHGPITIPLPIETLLPAETI